ncbi:serine/threonine-protein kinase [Peribacillus deserti]|uniref:Serine/threonine-protein kinase n=1 Tax=Peribacillus deserti TaxID=673318 RepID=A0ABS2QH89_9BACI|nr:protein kinase [Peribacillus deserti]MBM7692522.1 serine/threonine-protein kinase [Peribacillus deserti]
MNFKNMHPFKTLMPEKILEKRFIKELEKHHSLVIMSEAGSGSYGKAYIIQNTINQGSFVLKRLRKRKWRSNDALLAFQLEQKILQTLSHPAIPKFVSSGELLGIPFYIMERKYGYTLEENLFTEQKVFSEEQSFHLACKLLKVITYMHEKGIVHRDIRIPNVLLQGDSISLIDFGLGSFIDRNEEYDCNQHPKQSKTYLSDLYCLGHFLLFLLYSNFKGDSCSGRSWEEELNISMKSREIIKKLLLAAEPYPSSKAALDHVNRHIQILRGDKNGII